MTDYEKEKIKNLIKGMTVEEIEIVIDTLYERAVEENGENQVNVP